MSENGGLKSKGSSDGGEVVGLDEGGGGGSKSPGEKFLCDGKEFSWGRGESLCCGGGGDLSCQIVKIKNPLHTTKLSHHNSFRESHT